MNVGAELRSHEFDSGFLYAARTAFPEALGEGLMKGMAAWLADAIKEKPRVPHRVGTLWRSQQVDRPDLSRAEIAISGGFNVRYAAYQHAGRRRDGSHVVKYYSISKKKKVPAAQTDYGPEFLSSKIKSHGSKYMKIAADHCFDKIGGWGRG